MATTNYCPLSGRAFWPSTVVSIPVGWTRDTDFDDCFCQGVVGDSRTQSGGTHTHTAAHTHTGASHRHTFAGASTTVGGGATAFKRVADSGDLVEPVRFSNHSHSVKNSNYTVIVYSNSTTDTASDSAIPPSVTVIVIKPDDATQHLPIGVVGYSDQTTAPTGWHVTDGAGGTINLDGQYLIGAATGADGGAATGAATHNHGGTLAHTHDSAAHVHATLSCGASAQVLAAQLGADDAMNSVHHTVSLDSAVGETSGSANATIGAATFEPAYRYLLGIQNTGAAADTPLNVVLPFVDVTANIPTNWLLCDGNGGTQDMTTRQPKVTVTGVTVGTSGGSNTHSHTSATTHQHTHAAHTHSATEDSDIVTGFTVSGGTLDCLKHVHGHIWTIGNAAPSSSAESLTTGSTDGRYKFREVAWIKKISNVAARRCFVVS